MGEEETYDMEKEGSSSYETPKRTDEDHGYL